CPSRLVDPDTLRCCTETLTPAYGPSRAAVLNEAAIYVPAPRGIPRVALEAPAAGAAVAAPRGVLDQPPLAAAEMGRLAEDEAYRTRRAAEARASVEGQTFAEVARELEEICE